MLKPKIKVEINLVPGKLTPEAEGAWGEFWNKTQEITAARNQPPGKGFCDTQS